MPLTSEADESISPPAPSVKARTPWRDHLMPVELTKNLKHIWLSEGKYKIELLFIELEDLNRRRDQTPGIFGVPVYYSLYPYHITLWPAPDKSYKVELEYSA